MSIPVETALYLFGVVSPGAAPLDDRTGLSGTARLFTIDEAGVSAVVSAEPLMDFTGPGADKRLSDLNWLAPRLLRHQTILSEMMASASVFPAGFGTLFSCQEQLRAFLVLHSEAILAFLRTVEGREEWGLKVILNRTRALETIFEETVQARPELSALPPGRRYMEERRIRAEAEKTLDPWLEIQADLLLRSLEPFREPCVRRPVKSEGAGAQTVFNWAFLLVKDAVEPFRENVERARHEHERRGLELRLSGPWPPYSFTPQLSY